MTKLSMSIALEKFTTFGDLLKYLRRRTGMTQRELSIQVGYSNAQISRLESNERLPDLPTITARFLSALMLEEHPEVGARLLELAANMRKEDAPATGFPPYKGLYFFDEADAELFFGREELTARLVKRIKNGAASESRFLAVIGASGSGKSSVVRAGVLPTLRWEHSSANWLVHVITPTAHPLEALANSFYDPFPPATTSSQLSAQKLSGVFGEQVHGLHEHLVSKADEANAEHILIVVDQFEELFTLCKNEAEQLAFAENLLTATNTPHGPGIVLIAMRADFYAHCARFDSLRHALAHQQEYIGPMNMEELRKATEKPAELGHWELEPGLADLMLQDIGASAGGIPEPGALPLLSHALLETWKHRRGRTLTLSGYTASGGVRGSIAETAEAVFHDQLEPEQRDIARQIFLRLTEMGIDDATADTRRRVRFDELISKPDERVVIEQVLLTLADSRLITTDQDAIEVAHEALIREWPTLRDWLEEDREGLRLHRHLTEAAQEWGLADRDSSILYRGARLAQAIEWSEENATELNLLEKEFLRSSQMFAEKEIKEREEQQKRELEAARQIAEEQARVAALQRSRSLWLTGISLIAIALAIFAFLSRSQAQREAAVNSSLVLATKAENAFENGESDLALALALEAVDTSEPPPEALRALSIIAMAPGTRAILEGHEHTVQDVVFSPNEGLALSGSCGKLDSAGACVQGELILWNIEGGVELRRFTGHTDWVNGVAFSPDGQTFLSASSDGTLILWDTETGDTIRSLEGHTGEVNDAKFSPDGQLAISASDDANLILWDVATGEVIRQFDEHEDNVNSVAFSPDGKTLLSGSDDTSIILWDVETGAIIHRFDGHVAQITDLAFVPDGSAFLSTAKDQSLFLWDIETREEVSREVFGGGANFLAISPDGHTVAHGVDFEVHLRDIAQWQDLGRLLGHSKLSSITSIAVSPDGHLMLSGADDGSLRLWNLQGQNELNRFQAEEMLFGVAVSPDGDRVLVGGVTGDGILWDIEQGQVIRRLKGDGYPIVPGGVAFSPDGQYALVMSSDIFGKSGVSSLVILDTETGEEIQSFEEHTTYARSAAFSPDSRTVLSGSQGLEEHIGDLILWDAETGQIIRYFDTTDDITSISFNADGTRALTTSAFFANATLWDVETGHQIRRFEGEMSLVLDAAFGPNETTILTASEDGILRLWDIDTGLVLRRYLGHQSTIWTLDISPAKLKNPDAHYVISGSNDGMIILWDFETGKELRRFTGHKAWVPDIAFSPDGKAAFSVSLDSALIQWQTADLPLDALIEWIDSNRYIRELTCDERSQYYVEPLCE